ncbi:tyrosine--tRNA ligase [Neobacillus piezotolerans]|uniref:Tyrosine--tRNA ligase n=1 Tax=Neobacillus piezotolerans TaxID=2259171 RepID=A0A3D8GRP4_9BACI|nr:tyrosine--tRNA ligase [Neobacillus piezotolerans]RDU37144.1 tyrosine--tRNA ligase [Neobacillus piezotolerans]
MFLVPEEQLPIILKGVQTVVDERELKDKLQYSYDTRKPLIVKLGLDPSAPDIHLGHAVVLRKMKQLQDLGHQIVIIIGDFTGRIGDPTGKSKGRAALSSEQVKENAKTYYNQIFKILDENKTIVRFNSEWLSALNFEDVIQLASSISVARMLERDDFQKRYKNEVPISLHEFFYPLMQGYDSVEIKADIELGGTDQTFNILMGRQLQKHFGLEKQIALFMPLLEGLDGIEKMSKSLGNYIGVNEAPEVMFKKVMEVPDSLIIKYFELATDEHPSRIGKTQERLEQGENPRDIKLELAEIITTLYHGEEEAEKAFDFFKTAFQKREIPENIPMLTLTLEHQTLEQVIPLLIENQLVKSKSEFIRLISQNGVSLNQQKLRKEDLVNVIQSKDVLQIGKKRFIQFMR